ncbi:MAG: ATP-binding protein [Bacteroidota bacterium]
MPRHAHSLTIPGRTSELARVRRHVEAWAEAAGLSTREIRQIRTAVDEAVANAIEHGVETESATVTIVSRPVPGGLAVTVRHRGERFDPTAPPVSLDEVRERRALHGYGLHLLAALVDEMGYTFRRGTNEVRLVKRKG